MSDGPDMRNVGGTNVGTLELGAIWPSLNQTLVWALMGVRSSDGLGGVEEELSCVSRQMLIRTSGMASGAEMIRITLRSASTLEEQPMSLSSTARIFPVLNLHAHACSLYSASKLLGLEFTGDGLNLNLGLPLDSYRFDSPLVGVVKTRGRFEGWYAPSRSGTWTVRITLPESAAGKLLHAVVNGKPASLKKLPNGVTEISGSSSAQQPMRWSLIEE